MSIFEPTIAHLRETGSLKWTGMTAANDAPTYGAWVAEMDFGTAPVVEKRLIKGIKDGFLGYLPPWLQDRTATAVSAFQERQFGWTVKPGWVRTTNSVLGIFAATIDHFTRPGSQVIVPTPAYMPFLTIPGAHGREVIEVPSLHSENASGEKAWALDLEGIKAGLEAGAGMVVLCNPWNPTGRSLSVAELKALQSVVKDYDAVVFSDEIHAPLTFPETPTFTSYAALGPGFADHTVTAVAASKAWNIAGLPAAQVILPDRELRNRWDEKAAAETRPAVPLGQIAAISAYDAGQDWLGEVLRYVGQNLDLLDEALAGTGVDYSRPEATYLTWLGFENFDIAGSPAQLLLNEAQVATNAGKTLGAPYSKWVRLNAAMARPAWEKTLEQLTGFIQTLPRT